ncbi:hypothetical protein K458DRAFT_409302 [Lentithecium fluviatile CBS 122367]|uniref:Uncharacterized protein n=1 Tax=Lentithecium fluviatile CBS 122367 TaxID=1168545 RepID=A0A6G1IJA4_9PLEO|nr:hypothetical protein K458DRAFT_409302 [Lentithecium fluviatile CBS 122367]
MLHLLVLVLACLTTASTLHAGRQSVHSDGSGIVRRDAFEVTRYAALGEAYATGLNVGNAYNDDKADHVNCRRFNKAFGPQIADDERIIGPKLIHFDFIACSGSKASYIWKGNEKAREVKLKTP